MQPRNPKTEAPAGNINLAVECQHLTRSFGKVEALAGVSLSVRRGEFFSLLGPSGCGKTTTLRLIGGFEEIEHGSVSIDGVDMRDVPPEKRPVNTVFQIGRAHV